MSKYHEVVNKLLLCNLTVVIYKGYHCVAFPVSYLFINCDEYKTRNGGTEQLLKNVLELSQIENFYL
jgi:hypothetical protein